MTRTNIVALASGLLLAAAPFAAALADEDKTMPESGRKFSTMLSGAVEVPGPGDSDGSGAFHGRINPGTGQLCYHLKVADVTSPTAAHIHRGAVGVAGPVVVTLSLSAPPAGEKTCTELEKSLAQELLKMPEGFYVNVHNAEFPAGAVRGQLGK